jgi:hypothetical protein
MVTFSLDDNQLRQILFPAEPLPPELRSELLRLTAAELAGAEPGDGSIARAARGALAKLLKAERLTRETGDPDSRAPPPSRINH